MPCRNGGGAVKVEDIKGMLARAARRAWPDAAKMSDLPFPEYWRAQREWLEFHAPHAGEKVMEWYAAGAVEIAVEAAKAGVEPKPWRVPEETRSIWQRIKDRRGCRPPAQDAWNNAAERAAEVKDRFGARARAWHGRLL